MGVLCERGQHGEEKREPGRDRGGEILGREKYEGKRAGTGEHTVKERGIRREIYSREIERTEEIVKRKQERKTDIER